MRNLVVLVLLVGLAGCAGGRYEASYPTCLKLAQKDGKLIRWLAAHHRRVEAYKRGHPDPEVARILERKRELYRERLDAFCI